MSLRSFLFVPGDSERKLVRGLASQADPLILDPEDAVAPSRKALAQGMVAEALAARAPASGEPQLWVRINPMDLGGLDDLAAVVRAGAGDFARGARLSLAGLSVVALASTHAGHAGRTRFCIVPRLEDGIASLFRGNVDVVVTEHGAADLRGLCVHDRAEALATVADPAFRPALEAA